LRRRTCGAPYVYTEHTWTMTLGHRALSAADDESHHLQLR
jgi:hypothetical protein